MDECEDGEIVDFDVEEEVYTPLERPATLTVSNHTPAPTVASESEDSSSSSSDSDSSSGPSSAKRSKVLRSKAKKAKAKNVHHPSGEGRSSKPNKYNIWSSSLQEEALTERLENCGAMQKYSRDRDIESYDFTLKYKERGEEEEEEDMKNDDDEEPIPDHLRTNKRKYNEKGSIKHRLGRCPSPSDERSQSPSWPRTILNLTVTAESSAEDIAKDIANKLSETKEELIVRVVEVAGKEKAIAVFQETQRIELDGGMLIMNRSRRRSPGGVFLFLIKGDDAITSDMKNRIFIEDIKESRRKVKNQKKAEHRQHVEKLRKALEEDGELPVLMSRAELAIQESLDNMKPVSNPPPSPATDTRGDSSNDSGPITSPVCYEDDVLDVYADTMEQF